MSYDQWKTASPYDDEPDPAEEAEKMAAKCEKYLKAHKELSDMNRDLELLLLSVMDTLHYLADEIVNN
jgi:hypothetical protein